MTDAEKGKRIAELVKKSQEGKATAQEIQELNGLMSGAAADLKAGKPMAPPPNQADFDAAFAASSPCWANSILNSINSSGESGPFCRFAFRASYLFFWAAVIVSPPCP